MLLEMAITRSMLLNVSDVFWRVYREIVLIARYSEDSTMTISRRRLLQLSLLSTLPTLPMQGLADTRAVLNAGALAQMREHFSGEIERGHRAGYVLSLIHI